MGFFKPQSCRYINETLTKIIKRWDEASEKERAYNDFINPDEPIVLMVPNPAWEGDADTDYGEDENGEEKYLCYHVMSHGGGADRDEDDEEIGHAGFQLTGMEMNYDEFLSNGRRVKGK